MWRPKKIGEVVAERICEFRDAANRVRQLKIVFGQPVRGPRAGKDDPWWCPVEVSGGDLDRFETIAGEDSLQALLLAVSGVERILIAQAKRRGAHIGAYGMKSSPILCHSGLVPAPSKKMPNQAPEPTAPSGRGSS